MHTLPKWSANVSQKEGLFYPPVWLGFFPAYKLLRYLIVLLLGGGIVGSIKTDKEAGAADEMFC